MEERHEHALHQQQAEEQERLRQFRDDEEKEAHDKFCNFRDTLLQNQQEYERLAEETMQRQQKEAVVKFMELREEHQKELQCIEKAHSLVLKQEESKRNQGQREQASLKHEILRKMHTVHQLVSRLTHELHRSKTLRAAAERKWVSQQMMLWRKEKGQLEAEQTTRGLGWKRETARWEGEEATWQKREEGLLSAAAAQTAEADAKVAALEARLRDEQLELQAKDAVHEVEMSEFREDSDLERQEARDLHQHQTILQVEQHKVR